MAEERAPKFADKENSVEREILKSVNSQEVKSLVCAPRTKAVRKHSPSKEEYRFDADVPNCLTEQNRLSIFNWNPGPRRGKEGAIEKHMAGKWHIITLQEAIEYLDSEYLTNRFYVNHYGGCAILFNKDTFHQDIKVTSFYLHDIRDQQQDVKERESGWVLQGVISRASFRRLPHDVILHIINQFAKKRGIGKKLLLTTSAVMRWEHVDLVAGDFNGAAWRRPCGNDRKPISIIEEAFADTDLPMPPGSTIVGPGAVPGEWADVCGFLRPPDFHEKWKVRLHGALSFFHSSLGLREKDQSCHHEVWMHLALTNPCLEYARRDKHDQRLRLKERSAPYQRNKGRSRAHGEQSDHSQSSQSSI